MKTCTTYFSDDNFYDGDDQNWYIDCEVKTLGMTYHAPDGGGCDVSLASRRSCIDSQVQSFFPRIFFVDL